MKRKPSILYVFPSISSKRFLCTSFYYIWKVLYVLPSNSIEDIIGLPPMIPTFPTQVKYYTS